MRTHTGMWLLSAAVMLGLTGLAGCGGDQGNEYRAFDKEKDKAPDAERGTAHSHDHGPHNGELIELGEEEYHAEVVFDEESEKITIYLLGPDAEKTVAIEAKELAIEMPGKDAPVTHALVATPQAGDEEGKSSRFETKNADLFDAFHHNSKAVGKFKVSLGGKEFSGEVKHVHGHAEK